MACKPPQTCSKMLRTTYIKIFEGKNVFDEVTSTFGNLKSEMMNIGHKLNLNEILPSSNPTYKNSCYISFLLADYMPLVSVSVQAMIKQDNSHGKIILGIRYRQKEQKFPELEKIVEKYKLENLSSE